MSDKVFSAITLFWIWVFWSTLEAHAYNSVTGANVRPIDAMFVQLRVCAGQVQP